MGWIDVAIPSIGGILLVARPSLFFRSAGDDTANGRKIVQLRKIGVVLLVVAFVYLIIKLATAVRKLP
jgi:hypothetical protein